LTPAAKPPGLSKSRYLAGLQCPKRLWLSVHEPDAPELAPDDALQALFDTGHRVTEEARTRVPGGVLVDAPPWERSTLLAATQRALEGGADVLYEAAFSHRGVFVRADILERSGPGWNLIEVKSATSVKEEHLPDAAIQRWVLEGAGLRVERVELMHLSRDCRYPDLSNLFVREDVTEEIADALADVPRGVRTLREMLAGPEPEMPIGPHCGSPHACAFASRCWAHVPEHSVHSLYRLGQARAFALWNEGVAEIEDLPRDFFRSGVQQRQREAIETGEVVVAPGLGAALDTLVAPLAYLDFETIRPALPCWDGLRPFDQVPVQLSVHAEQADGALSHREWLAAPESDPREEMARRLLAFTEGAGSVVVYNAAFERSRILELRDRFPAMAPALEALSERLWDLLPVVRNHVYHRDLHGSFSIKAVLPALVPGAGYEGMEIADGGAASGALERVLFDRSLGDEARTSLRGALLAYCRQDTLAMVELLGRLRALAAQAR